MKIQKILIAFTVIILTGMALIAVPQVYAQTTGIGTHMNFFQDFIQFISQKFGLDETKVQSAITEYKQQRKATITPRPTLTPQQMVDSEKTRLDQLVKDGKITSDQETAIINELSALRAKYNSGSLKDLTPDQRKTRMNTVRDEIISWAKSQGIDSSYVMPGFAMRNRGPGMRGRGKEWNERIGIVSPSPTE